MELSLSLFVVVVVVVVVEGGGGLEDARECTGRTSRSNDKIIILTKR